VEGNKEANRQGWKETKRMWKYCKQECSRETRTQGTVSQRIKKATKETRHQGWNENILLKNYKR
jgi:hypothetical protein